MVLIRPLGLTFLLLIGSAAAAGDADEAAMLDDQGHRAAQPAMPPPAGSMPRAAATAAAWGALGPYGGAVADVAASPGAPGVLLAGISTPEGGGALYRSTDNGINWTRQPFPSGVGVNDIEFAADGSVYIGTYGGMFRSVDQGQSWSLVDLGIGQLQSVLDVLLVPSQPQTLWVALSSSQGYQPTVLMRSVNGGSSWSNRTPPLSTPLNASGVAVNPANPDQVMATFSGDFSGGAVWVSTDGGGQWTNRSAGLPANPMFAVVHDGSRFLVGGGRQFASQIAGLYASTNLGAQWTPLHNGSWSQLTVSAIALDPANPSVILVATTGSGVHRSVDGGQSWQTGIGGTGTLAARSLRFIPGSSTGVLLAADSIGVLRSENAGSQFAISSTGINELSVSAIAANPLNPAELAIAYSGENEGGVYTSTDGGAHWTPAAVPPTRYEAIAFAADGTLYAASNGPSSIAPEGVYRRNGNGSWTGLGPDQGPLFETEVLAIAFDPDDPQVILIGGGDTGTAQGNEATIWRSANAGANWSKRYDAQPGDRVEDVQVRSGGVAVAAFDGFTDPQQGGALRSIDGGSNWNKALQGLPAFAREAHVCLAADGNFMLAAWTSFATSASVYRSPDGLIWQTTGWSGPATSDIACDPGDASRVYLALRSAPWAARSANQGVSFENFGSGLDGLGRTQGLGIAGGRLLLASQRGSFAANADALHADGFEAP